MKAKLRIICSLLLLCGTSISAVAEDFSIHNVRQQKSNKGGAVMKGFVQNIFKGELI